MRAHQIKQGMTVVIYGSTCKVQKVRKRGGDMIELQVHDKNYGGTRTHILNHAETVQPA